MGNEKNKTILIVDDEESVTEFLKFSLERDGFSVITAENGGNALKLIAKNRIDMVLLDMMMPGKSGFEVVRMMQAEEYKDIPIIMMSGKFVDDSYQNTLKFEPNVRDYMTKPVRIEMLLYKVNSILGTLSSAEKKIEERHEHKKDIWNI